MISGRGWRMWQTKCGWPKMKTKGGRRRVGGSLKNKRGRGMGRAGNSAASSITITAAEPPQSRGHSTFFLSRTQPSQDRRKGRRVLDEGGG